MPEYHLPENAEASIIGCLLLCPDTKPAVSRLVNEGDFSPGLNAALFSAALELEEPDSAVFHAAVKRRGYTLPDGFFRELGDIAISRANVELYCSLLRDKAQKRNLSALADEMRASIADDLEAAAIISGALSRLGEIERGTLASDIASPSDAWEAFFAHRERVLDGKGAVPTGFQPLDRMLGKGMLRSGLYVLAARPGMGKTTLALQIADSVAKTTGPVLFVSLEMAVEQIQGKRIARLTDIPSDEILLGDENSLDYDKIVAASNVLKTIPVYISRRPSATVAQIRHMAKSIPGVQCVVVDYLGKVTPADKRASRYEAVTDISGQLKTLAVELGVPVLALAQLNRENTGRSDKRPQLSDLRDSGAIEQDADGVIMLHRSDYYELDETPMGAGESVELEIIVRKNRHGRIGRCSAGFFPATGKIVKIG